MATSLDRQYRPHLVHLWNFCHNTQYGKDHTFTKDELLTITPELIYSFCANKVYGKPNPTEEDNPTKGRSASIEFTKKAISFFMPNRLAHWDVRTGSGNPTKSVKVNDLIKLVKKKEVRRQGTISSARRPMVVTEFVQVVKHLRAESSTFAKYTAASYFIFQFHLIARLDDVANFSHSDITPHIEYDFALKSKMCWSKNVLEERSAPSQIILGARDPNFCTLLALAIHFEFGLLLGNVSEETSLFACTKGRISDLLKKVVEDDRFMATTGDGTLGTHSIRKFPATYARNNGCDRDDVEARGRWKSQKRIVDTYIGTCLPYPDAKVASVLCVGGTVKYKVKTGSRVTDGFLLQHVVPHLAELKGREVALVLGRALLWGLCDTVFSPFLEGQFRTNALAACAALGGRTLAEGENPVQKIQLIVSGHGGNLYITDMDEGEDDGDGVEGNVAPSSINRMNDNNRQGGEVGALFSQMRTLQRQQVLFQNELSHFKCTSTDLLTQLHRSIQRLAQAPIFTPRVRIRTRSSTQQQYNTQEEEEVEQTAVRELGTDQATIFRSTLSARPRTLYVLWQEYEFGVAGRKAAKLFNAVERGRSKFTYCLRKPFWDLVVSMISHGYNHNTAIDKIYEVYGHISVVKVLRCIRRDKRTGGNDELSSFITIMEI